MLPRILDVPRRNFHWIFSVELHSCHDRSDADAWSQWTEREDWQCWFSSTATPQASQKKLRMRPETEVRILKVLLIETCWIVFLLSFPPLFFLFSGKGGPAIQASVAWLHSSVTDVCCVHKMYTFQFLYKYLNYIYAQDLTHFFRTIFPNNSEKFDIFECWKFY